jgi:hypothetical protein
MAWETIFMVEVSVLGKTLAIFSRGWSAWLHEDAFWENALIILSIFS